MEQKISMVFAKGIDALPQAVEIRKEIFMEEQGFVNEFDETDKTALQCVLFLDDEAAATGRMYPDKEHEKTAEIGRIAVKKKYRHMGLGSRVVTALEERAAKEGYERCVLAAQVRAKDFYRSVGYEAYGELFDDEGIPHTMMKKSI